MPTLRILFEAPPFVYTTVSNPSWNSAMPASVRADPAALPMPNQPVRFGVATTLESLAFDRDVRPILEIVLTERAEAVIGVRADPELQARTEELARKAMEGELTEDERAEYAGYVRANKFVAILKRQAQQIANSQS